MPLNTEQLIPTRRSLLSRLKDWDDQESWRDFFNIYWRLIYRSAIKAGLSNAEAQDVVQETLLELARKMPGFKYDPAVGSFKGWLLRTTQWKISGQFKRRRRESREVNLASDNGTGTAAIEGMPDPAALNLDSFWDAEWERNLLDAAMENVKRKVSPAQFEMFYLNVMKEKPVREVAATLEVSAAQVYLAKHRVGGLLKREIEGLQRKMS
jgi:RNA polymerase sigma-70 factor (ECF subfamily)